MRFRGTKSRLLGIHRRRAGIEIDQCRVETVTRWPTPTSYTDVQIFLRFVNFYRRFIARFSHIAAPLTALLKGSKNGKKDGPLLWSASAANVFRQLQEAFTKGPLLVHFDPTGRIRIETDGSDFAISAILLQLRAEDGQ